MRLGVSGSSGAGISAGGSATMSVKVATAVSELARAQADAVAGFFDALGERHPVLPGAAAANDDRMAARA